MGSYAGQSSPDYEFDKYNNMHDNRNIGSSGLTAGVQSGLSSIEELPRGVLQPEQETVGSTFRPNRPETGSDSKSGKAGKSFKVL